MRVGCTRVVQVGGAVCVCFGGAETAVALLYNNLSEAVQYTFVSLICN